MSLSGISGYSPFSYTTAALDDTVQLQQDAAKQLLALQDTQGSIQLTATALSTGIASTLLNILI